MVSGRTGPAGISPPTARSSSVRRLLADLENTYTPLPDEVAAGLLRERRQMETLIRETGETFDWLRQREQAASIAKLYGN